MAHGLKIYLFIYLFYLATGFKDVKNRLRAGCLGYHSDAPEQHEINSYITIFLLGATHTTPGGEGPQGVGHQA